VILDMRMGQIYRKQNKNKIKAQFSTNLILKDQIGKKNRKLLKSTWISLPNSQPELWNQDKPYKVNWKNYEPQ
jgi:hypothetical protein